VVRSAASSCSRSCWSLRPVVPLAPRWAVECGGRDGVLVESRRSPARSSGSALRCYWAPDQRRVGAAVDRFAAVVVGHRLVVARWRYPTQTARSSTAPCRRRSSAPRLSRRTRRRVLGGGAGLAPGVDAGIAASAAVPIRGQRLMKQGNLLLGLAVGQADWVLVGVVRPGDQIVVASCRPGRGSETADRPVVRPALARHRGRFSFSCVIPWMPPAQLTEARWA